MRPPEPTGAPFRTFFFPQQVALIAVERNVFPMGYWTVISRNPFRVLLCVGLGNHSLGLIRKHREAAMHFMPWSERERVVRAGWVSGRDVDKAAMLGFAFRPAEKLTHTQLVEGAEAALELTVLQELPDLSAEFALFVMDVVATHGNPPPTRRQPILYLSGDDFATLGERWRFQK